MTFADINLDKWNSLPKSYQAVLTHAGQYASNWMMSNTISSIRRP